MPRIWPSAVSFFHSLPLLPSLSPLFLSLHSSRLPLQSYPSLQFLLARCMRATFKAPEECHLDGSWLGYLCARSLRDSRICRHFLPPTERPPTDHRLVNRLRSSEYDGEYIVCAILYVTPDSHTVSRAFRKNEDGSTDMPYFQTL